MDMVEFPILSPYTVLQQRQDLLPSCPPWIPFAMLAPHEEQAMRNHSQTLERLASRGGLDPSEALAILDDRPWRRMVPEDSIMELMGRM